MLKNKLDKSGFSLYIWLILFTLVISIVSIVIFNYVSADIKTSNKFFKNINQFLKLDSYAIISVELYRHYNNLRRQGDYSSGQQNSNILNSNILNTGYRYEITPIDSSKLLVNILKSNDLYAKYIMLYSLDLGSINKIVGNPTTFKAGNNYNNTLIASNEFYIENTAGKIFNNLIILPTTTIRATGDGNPFIDRKDLTRYTNNLITDIDIQGLAQNLNQYISQYYLNYYSELYQYLDQSEKLFDNDDVAFTKEGYLILKKQARVSIIKESGIFQPRIEVTINNNHYYFAVTEDVIVGANNSNAIDYETNKVLQTNDLDLANAYANRQNNTFNYKPGIAKIMSLDDKYICVKTPQKEFIILALEEVNLDSSVSLYNNVQVIVAPSKVVNIKAPFSYEDYDILNHFLPSDSNSFIRVIADNINIDADGSNIINITGSYVAFYDNTSSINIIDAPNDIELNIFGSFQTYGGLKINGNDISTTSAKEYYYSDPRVDKINDIANLKIYRTQILAREIKKLPDH